MLEYCAALPTSPQLPTPATPPGPGRQEGALKLSAVGFTSSDCFLKQQQQHKVLVWLTGNLKLSRQSSLPPLVILPTHTHRHTHPPPAKNASTGTSAATLCSSQGRAPTDLRGAWCWGGILKGKTREKFGKENPLVTGHGSRYCKKRGGGGEGQ